MKSIRNKIIIIFCLITIASILLTAFPLFSVSSKALRKESLNKAQSITDRYAEEINGWFNNKINEVKEVNYHITYMDNYDYDYLCDYFSSKSKTDEDVEDYYAGIDNKMITGTRWTPPKDYKVTEKDWYKEAMNSKDTAILKPYTDAETNATVFTISEKIKKDGATKGIIASDVKIDKVLNMISSFKPGKNSYAFLVDNDGDILVHPEEQFAPKEDNFQNLASILDGRLKEVASNKNGIYQEKDFDGQDKYFITSTIQSTGWKICLVVPKDEITSPLKKVINSALIDRKSVV